MPSEEPKFILTTRCFVTRLQDKRLLYVQRSARDSHCAGQWEVPGGKFEPKQSLKAATQSELGQEIGCTVEIIHPVVSNYCRIIEDGPYNGWPYIMLFSIVRITGGSFSLSHEHDDAKWLHYDDALALDLTPDVRRATIDLRHYLT